MKTNETFYPFAEFCKNVSRNDGQYPNCYQWVCSRFYKGVDCIEENCPRLEHKTHRKMYMELKEYIGDGVYAIFDGFGIWLHANDYENPTDQIYLEPSVLESLNKFEKSCTSQRNQKIEKKQEK